MKKQFVLRKQGNQVINTAQIVVNPCSWLMGLEWGVFERSRDKIKYFTLHVLFLAITFALKCNLTPIK